MSLETLETNPRCTSTSVVAQASSQTRLRLLVEEVRFLYISSRFYRLLICELQEEHKVLILSYTSTLTKIMETSGLAL